MLRVIGIELAQASHVLLGTGKPESVTMKRAVLIVALSMTMMAGCAKGWRKRSSLPSDSLSSEKASVEPSFFGGIVRDSISGGDGDYDNSRRFYDQTSDNPRR